MPSRNKVVVGIIALAILAGGFLWYFQSRNQVTNNEQNNNSFSEKNLLGSWVDKVNSQEIDFAVETEKNVLNSFVDKRPEYINCPWKLEHVTLSITCPTISDSFKIVSISNYKLVIDREGARFNYQRIH